MEAACFYLRWLLSSGILDHWAGDRHLGFWRGDNPDARVKDGKKYGDLCSRRSSSLRGFVRSVCVTEELNSPDCTLFTLKVPVGVVHVRQASYPAKIGGVISAPQFSHFGEFHQSVAVAVISAAPRWRFARCLEIERDGDETKYGGIVRALESFPLETDAIIQGEDNFAEPLIG